VQATRGVHDVPVGPLTRLPSTVKGAGFGVFTTAKLEAGQRVVVCTGEYVECDEQSADRHGYSFELWESEHKDVVCLDCYDLGKSNIARWINSNHGTRRRANVFLRWHGVVPVVVVRDAPIPPRTELLLDYTL
jgi:hypothetical protein